MNNCDKSQRFQWCS